MAKLVYSMIMSLDGYVADEAGNFDWAAPDEDVHQYFNDMEREVGTHLYGRRMYETMVYWETADSSTDAGGRSGLRPGVAGGGQGRHALPDGVRIDLELMDERRLGEGMVHLHYRVRA